jgi:hypothetical protein
MTPAAGGDEPGQRLPAVGAGDVAVAVGGSCQSMISCSLTAAKNTCCRPADSL